jgi:hypothetical protein
MCDDVPVEIRPSVGKRVGDSLIGALWLLGGAFSIATGIILAVDPASVGSAGPLAGRSALAFCAGAAMAYVGFVYTRSVITDRLIVTSNGLVCRAGGWTRARTTTIPWSTVTSFTVKTSSSRGYRHAVYAVLATGQQVGLTCTKRSGQAAATTIARELTTFASTAARGAAAGGAGGTALNGLTGSSLSQYD